MTATAWQQLVEQIDLRARQLQPREVALSLLFAIPFLLGWLLARVAGVAWMVLAWTWSAGLAGWEQAGGLDGRRKGRGVG
jgi:hypothetical protein